MTMYDVFGFAAHSPPYEMIGPSTIRRTENWRRIEGKHGEYDEYFDFYECRQPNGDTWYHRETKPQWVDKIPADLLYAPITKIKQYLQTL